MDDFEQAEMAGRKVVERLIAHSATRGIIAGHGPALRELLAEHLSAAYVDDQWAVTDLALAAWNWPNTTAQNWATTGVALWLPDTAPLEHSPPTLWTVYVDTHAPGGVWVAGPWSIGWADHAIDRVAAHRFVGHVREKLDALAAALVSEGVPVDTGAAVDLVALAQLALCAIDWGQSADSIAARLTLPAAVGYTTDARWTVSRRGLSDEANRLAGRLRGRLERAVSGEHRASASDGGRRSARTRSRGKERRQEALRQVLDEFPKTAQKSDRDAAGTLCRGYDRTGSPGARLVELLGGERPEAEMLRKDLAAIRK